MKKIATLLLLCTIVEALEEMKPGATWYLDSGQEYRNLRWLDTRSSKPTESEVTAWLDNCKTQEPIKRDQRTQAIRDLKDTSKTPQERLDAVIKILGI